MMSPEDSWVSKWQRVSKCLSYPGQCSVENVPKGLQDVVNQQGAMVGKMRVEKSQALGLAKWLSSARLANLSLLLGTHMLGGEN